MDRQAKELAQNIPGARVDMGETDPISNNDTERGRELNRRVEVAIYASEAYRAEMAKH